jgi:GrpB-like predicted nucleotidyltransferase (UPF0157 family)
MPDCYHKAPVSLHPSQMPVRLETYTEAWVERFEQEKVLMRAALGNVAEDVQHIGSTSVPNLMAKPTVDILLGTHDFPWPASSDAALSKIGYTFYKENHAKWLVYLKGWQDNVRGYHLHVVEFDSEHWHRHLLFRDYLRTHPDESSRYAELKQRLVIEARGERGTYQDGKKEFIESIMLKAKEWAGFTK